ncbi:MAG: hypothetical protein ACI37R_01260 [Candidatus Avigastranaerophilus sp.]
MSNNKNFNRRSDYFYIIFLLLLIFGISLFNFIVDPYYIFRDSTIRGFNDVKTHKYSNKRTITNSDIKINNKGKDTAFTGNCMLSHYGKGLDNVAFFTIPVTKIEEVAILIENIHKIAPQIKKIYWGVFFDDLYHFNQTTQSDILNKVESPRLQTDDFINLFFSWNTTKYSIETVMDSIKNKGQNSIYIYPYREIAKKTYDKTLSFDFMSQIQDIYNYAKSNDIELIIYYSPIHISKKIHMFSKGIWNTNLEFKKELAQITPFYDYSLSDKYNTQPLDENSINFIDNVHPATNYNNMLVEDLLSADKKIGKLITKDNADRYNKEDTEYLKTFINTNKIMFENIKNVTPDMADIKIKADK